MLMASCRCAMENFVFGSSTSGIHFAYAPINLIVFVVLIPPCVCISCCFAQRTNNVSPKLVTFREFRLSDDMFAQDSIELLKQSGIDFAKMEARGIDVSNFGELLMSSGIVLNEDVSPFAPDYATLYGQTRYMPAAC